MPKTQAVPRRKQAQILDYTSGRMGVAAVPGSGKTWTLSLLAAKLVREAKLGRGQQVLVVTLVNSARGKFEQQVRDFLDEGDLGTLYRVRTLHGLANDIISERPGLVGLSDDFQILDDYASREIVREAVAAWFNADRDFGVEQYIKEEDRKKDRSRWMWREEAIDIALDFIRQAKDYRQRPDGLRAALSAYPAVVPLAEMCVNIYEAYERSLRYRGAADFQDLIRLALDALDADSDFLARLRHRWPFILEDEAQDSSKLQEEILRRLVGPEGNWVRVGDPNQAIYETFTTADPKYLRNFLNEAGVESRDLPDSGRSAPAIIGLANRLIEWSLAHPLERIRTKRPLTPPMIRPLDEGNPKDSELTLQLHADREMTPEEERVFVAESLRPWLEANPDKTVAILLPTNVTGADMAKVLRDRQIKHTEMLRATTATRQVAGSLLRIMNFLVEPMDAQALSDAFMAWRRDERDAPETQAVAALLKRAAPVEQFTAPRDKDWLIESVSSADLPGRYEQLEQFRALVKRWQES
ncbi:MAG: ATP-dependent helicase, partial [Acidobacteriota bacterium]